MRLLLTRPQPECKTTADRLRGLGHEVDEASLLRFVPTPTVPLPVGGVAALAFTSRRAVSVLQQHPDFSKARLLPAFTVGDATARACRNAGFQNIRSADGDVAALSRLIIESRHHLREGAVLYPAAKDRAADLETLLAADGVTCRTVPVYQMVVSEQLAPSIIKALGRQHYDGVLIFSKRTAETFVGLLKRHNLHHIFSSLRIFAISSQAAEPLDAFEHVNVSREPRENTLLDLVLADC